MLSSDPDQFTRQEQKPLTMIQNSPGGEWKTLDGVPLSSTTATDVSFSTSGEPLVFLTGSELRAIEADPYLTVSEILDRESADPDLTEQEADR